MPPSRLSGGITAAKGIVMNWTRSKIAETDLDFSLFRIQPIINASFVSGSLTAAMLNLTALVVVTAVKQYLPHLLCLGVTRHRHG